jgi:hypothetical protein
MDRQEPEFLAERDDAIPQIKHDTSVELFLQRGLPRLPSAVEQYDWRVGHSRADRVLNGSLDHGEIFTELR